MLCALVFAVTVFCGCSSEPQERVLVVDLSRSGGGVDTRIIGGRDAAIEDYPYAVQILQRQTIGNSQSLKCGGTLLTRRHVLSAAHCFVDLNNVVQDPRLLNIRVGTATLNRGGSVHRVSTIIVHDRYNISATNDHDVAILLLARPVAYSRRVGAASIPRQGAVVPDNTTLAHVGWGRTDAQVPSPSPTLQQVSIRKISLNVCAARYAYLQQLTGQPFFVTENMICAGILDVGGKDSCQGDSGGPLVLRGGGGAVVVGLTSWGWGCAEPQYPGVSTRVSRYTDWIEATVYRFNNASLVKPAALIFTILISFILNYI